MAHSDRLGRADGDARFVSASFAVLASLSGPIEARPQSELPSRASLDVLLRPLPGLPGTRDKAAAEAVRTAIQPSIQLGAHPRTLLLLVLQQLHPPCPPVGPQADAALAVAINAATLAFLRAGSVHMRGVVTAVAVAAKHSTGGGRPVFILGDGDGYPADHTDDVTSGCFAFLFTSDPTADASEELVWTNWRRSPARGEAAPGWSEAYAAAVEGARRVRDDIKASLAESRMEEEEG